MKWPFQILWPPHMYLTYNYVSWFTIYSHLLLLTLVPNNMAVHKTFIYSYYNGCLLVCSAVQSDRSLPIFQRSLLPPS
jgi:hypothetical protein